MLMSRRTKYRRPHRSSYEGRVKAGYEVPSGEYGLMADTGAYANNHQIEAARITMTRYMEHGGKVWIRIFPRMVRAKKPFEVCMGSGKGVPRGWVAVVEPGRVIFEIVGVLKGVAHEVFHLTTHKLSAKTKFIVREREE